MRWTRPTTIQRVLARAMELGLGERSPAKGKSPVAGKVNHDLGMFVGTKGEEGKAANTDLFVSGMTLDKYLSNVIMKGPVPEICGVGDAEGMGFTPPKPSKVSQKPQPKPDHSNTAPQFIKGMSLETYMKQGAKRSKKPSSSGVQKQSKGVDPNVSATVGEGGQILNFDGKGTAQSDLSSESSDAFAEGKSDDDPTKRCKRPSKHAQYDI